MSQEKDNGALITSAAHAEQQIRRKLMLAQASAIGRGRTLLDEIQELDLTRLIELVQKEADE